MLAAKEQTDSNSSDDPLEREDFSMQDVEECHEDPESGHRKVSVQSSGGISRHRKVSLQSCGGISRHRKVSVQSSGGISRHRKVSVQSSGGISRHRKVSVQSCGGISRHRKVSVQSCGGILTAQSVDAEGTRFSEDSGFGDNFTSRSSHDMIVGITRHRRSTLRKSSTVSICSSGSISL